jgi:hypothetical protein
LFNAMWMLLAAPRRIPMPRFWHNVSGAWCAWFCE